MWLHAVSVGEVLTSVRLLGELREALPGARLYVSVSTLAGRALADEKLAGVADAVFYAPLDFAFAVRRVMRRMRPRVLIVQETEIWPNLWNEAKRFGAGLVVVNGRISDKAFPKYKALGWFFRGVMGLPDRVLAQGELSLARFRELGAPVERSGVGGNLKYDFDRAGAGAWAGAPEVVRGLVERSHPEKIWIAASTMPPAVAGDPEEDEAVIAAFQELSRRHERLLLVLAPRKPELFDQAAERLERAGVRTVRRSRLRGDEALELPGALVLDSIGELSSLFAMADAVFMGGTLVRRGGHNILEPAFAGKAVVTGPSMENFAEMAEEFRAAGAVITVQGVAELAGAVGRVLEDEAYAREMGEKARRLAESKRGATGLVARVCVELFGEAVPRRAHGAWSWVWLGPWAALWKAGVKRRRAKRMAGARAVAKPVVSVGGLGMGGAGKTPMAIWLAEELGKAGVRPGFLTRGYRRQSLEKVVVIEAGATAAVTVTGDEAQLLLRSGLGPLGIGADRRLAGEALLRGHEVDVLVMDDGFQHWRLRRVCDVVLLDALDPLSGGAGFPLGRQRESFEALGRAQAVVVTRGMRRWPGLEKMIARHTSAPVFYSRFVARGWRRLGPDGGCAEERVAEALGAKRPVAFCGLGNPASFWSTLAGLGIRTARRWRFGDHHKYRPMELRRLAAQAKALGADAMLTTAKDVQNLPAEVAALCAEIPLWWLEIGMEVDRPDELVALVRRRLAAGG